MKFGALFCIIICFIKNAMFLVHRKAIIPKVVGGTPVDLKRYPHVARFYNEESMCAGVILNSCCVLTAAHCMDYNQDVANMAVVVGSQSLFDYKGQWFGIVKYILHENYNTTIQFGCDIALLFLDRRMQFGVTVQKAILVHHGDWMRDKERDFHVSGWGMTQNKGSVSPVLLMADLEFINQSVCEKMHGMNLTEDIFCLYGRGKKDACRGDSGGGVMWKGMIVGLTSHGNGGCAKINGPTMFANVWYFRDWIQRQIESFITGCNDRRFCEHKL